MHDSQGQVNPEHPIPNPSESHGLVGEISSYFTKQKVSIFRYPNAESQSGKYRTSNPNKKTRFGSRVV